MLRLLKSYVVFDTWILVANTTSVWNLWINSISECCYNDSSRIMIVRNSHTLSVANYKSGNSSFKLQIRDNRSSCTVNH